MPGETTMYEWISLTITRKKIDGITLIELMLAVAIAAVIAAIAVPMFSQQINRMNIRIAVAEVSGISADIERFQMNNERMPADLDELNIASITDPWGNDYVYNDLAGANPGDSRKDRNLVPLNTDFDLYSSGKDGDSQMPLTANASRDDIVRANNGGFIGLAEDY